MTPPIWRLTICWRPSTRRLDSRRPLILSMVIRPERIAINTPIQGTAADLIKLAMIRLDRVLKERGLAARMILQVHDELLLEAPDGEWQEVAVLAKREMEGVADLKIPLKVELKSGPNWAEMSGAA